MSQAFDVIVIGAGAAGLMAAAQAGQRGRKVLLLEHTAEIGAKIIISGGGRCNFTNLDVRPDRFISNNPHFVRSALARYTQHDFIDLVRRHQIEFYEKTLGQLFCEGAGSARRIVEMLMAECAVGQVIVATEVKVEAVSFDGRYQLKTSVGAANCESLIIATGGLSIPKLGATGFAYDIAAQFDVPVIAPAPALVPLVFGHEDLQLMRPLSGVSLDGRAQCGKTAFDEGMVFTHRGLSGPAILQISSYWRKGQAISLNLMPALDLGERLVDAKRQKPRKMLHTILAELLPSRLAQAWTERAQIDQPMADLKDQTLRELANSLTDWQLQPVGDEGYQKAEVTRGGIDTNALSQKTMEVKSQPGLYFIGEAVDVTGWLGGYNFQWAWSSGFAAGQAA